MKKILTILMVLLPSMAIAQTPLNYSDGSQPVSGTNSTFDHATNRINQTLNQNTDGEAPGTVVHETGLDVEVKVMPNGASNPYNAAAISGFAQDYSGSFGASVLGINFYGMVGWGNQNGNVWGGLLAGMVPAGADGSSIALELDSVNGGSDQPTIGGVHTKYGIVNNCIANVNCTVAEYIVGWQGHWHYGIRMPQWSVATGGYFFHYDVATMDRLGNLWTSGSVQATAFKTGSGAAGIGRTVNVQGLHGWCQMIFTEGLLTSSTC